MIRVGVSGACGRMGAQLAALIPQEKDMELAAAIEYPGHSALGKDVGAANGGPEVGVVLTSELPDGTDVLIDFSSPASTVQRAAECAARKVALVVGTTGLTEKDMRALTEASRSMACLASPNMSLGVNVLFQIAPKVARALGKDYDIEIVEVHHRQKKDAPSGTALRLAEEIACAMGLDPKKSFSYGRKGVVGERARGEIGIHAVRAGDVVGDHTVILSCAGERIELVHRAHSRDTFCRGAIAAARFLVGKKPGMYSMSDVLAIG